MGLAGCPSEAPELEVVSARDILAGPPLTLAWDAGSKARFLVRASIKSAEARWRPRQRRGALLPVTVEHLKEGLTRLTVTLPATVAAGRLELAFDDHTRAFSAELWPPRETLTEGFTEPPPIAPPAAATPEARARAAAAWKAAFRAAHREGRAEGARAVAEAARAAERAGHLGAASDHLSVAIYLASHANRQAEKERALLAAEAHNAVFPTVYMDAVLESYRGNLALGRGRPAEAAARQRAATLRADEGGLDGLAGGSAGEWLTALARLGRFDEGYDVIRAFTPGAETSTRSRADFTANQADFYFRRWAAGRESALDDALRAAAEAIELYEAAGDPVSARGRRIELAWWNARAGRVEAAARHLATLATLEPGPEPGEVAGLETLARARVALARGAPASVAATVTPLVANPPAGFDAFEAEVAIEGRVILAEAAALEGDVEAELEALEGALDAAHGRAARLGLGAEPAGLLGRRAPLLRRAVGRLVAAGALERAFALDDRHRSLTLRALSRRLAEAPAALSSTVAAPLRAELEKVVENGCLPPARGAGCAQRARALLAEIETATRRRGPPGRPPSLEAGHPSEVRAALREREQLWVDTATRGALRGFVLTREGLEHGLFSGPAEGHVFLVTSRLDAASDLLGRFAAAGGPTLSLLPHAGWLAGRSALPALSGRAVVLANPSGDLEGAEEEGARVARRFEDAQSWIGTGVEARALLDAVDGARLFHFAGHAEIMGRNPYATLFRIGPDDVLTLEDYLASHARVGLFVASGCKTAGDRARPGDVGFPQASLATGSHAVLATRFNIPDGAAATFMSDFYAARGARSPARGIVIATQKAIRRGDDVWRAFLLWGLPKISI